MNLPGSAAAAAAVVEFLRCSSRYIQVVLFEVNFHQNQLTSTSASAWHFLFIFPVVIMPDAGTIVGGYIVLFLSNTLSSSAGVGGGLLNVAIIHSILQHSFKESVVLSLATILGNTLMQLAINIRARHPNNLKRSVIYWDMIAIMLPAELGGSNLGTIFADAMPSTLLYIGAIIVLMLGGGFSLKKGLHVREIENERRKQGSKSIDLTATANPIVTTTGDSTVGSVMFAPSLEAALVDQTIITTIEPNVLSVLPPLELPWVVIGIVVAVWLCYLVLYIVMSLVPGCSMDWGLVMVFIYLILLVVVPGTFYYLMQQQSQYPKNIVLGDVHWTSSTFAVPVVTFSIGVLTAMLGFGGGELIGPYLLHLHIPPLVSTSTSGMISFLNTGLSLIHYGILGKVKFAESAVLFVIGMAAGLCGRLFSLAFVAKYDRASVLILTLVAVLGLSWIVYILYIATNPVSFAFEEVC